MNQLRFGIGRDETPGISDLPESVLLLGTTLRLASGRYEARYVLRKDWGPGYYILVNRKQTKDVPSDFRGFQELSTGLIEIAAEMGPTPESMRFNSKLEWILR